MKSDVFLDEVEGRRETGQESTQFTTMYDDLNPPNTSYAYLSSPHETKEDGKWNREESKNMEGGEGKKDNSWFPTIMNQWEIWAKLPFALHQQLYHQYLLFLSQMQLIFQFHCAEMIYLPLLHQSPTLPSPFAPSPFTSPLPSSFTAIPSHFTV
jgi:hypothetical protein